MTTHSDLRSTIRRYLDAIESNDLEGIMNCFVPEVIQQEFPNRLVPNGATRDLAAIKESALRGSKVVSHQRYEILNVIESGDQVALEVSWVATLSVPVGNIPAGGQMRARFAIFLQFRDGKIIRQHNYDCFDPF